MHNTVKKNMALSLFLNAIPPFFVGRFFSFLIAVLLNQKSTNGAEIGKNAVNKNKNNRQIDFYTEANADIRKHDAENSVEEKSRKEDNGVKFLFQGTEVAAENGVNGGEQGYGNVLGVGQRNHHVGINAKTYADGKTDEGNKPNHIIAPPFR